MTTADDGWGELAALYREHSRLLVRLAVLLVDDVGIAEEIVQDAFVLVHRRMGRLDQVERPVAYLRTTVVNLSRSRLRRRLVARRHPGLVERDAPAADERVGLSDDQLAVIAALHRLPRRQREVLVLRYWGEMSEGEIASTLGISNGSVKTHAHRGMAALEQELGS
jgi:RNA polymerase sigma-70 factor (sigma-E family)